MILVNISEVRQAISPPPVTQDQAEVLNGGTKWDTTGTFFFTSLISVVLVHEKISIYRMNIATVTSNTAM